MKMKTFRRARCCTDRPIFRVRERGTLPVSPALVLASFKILQEITASSRLFLKEKSCRLSRRLVVGDRGVVTNLELGGKCSEVLFRLHLNLHTQGQRFNELWHAHHVCTSTLRRTTVRYAIRLYLTFRRRLKTHLFPRSHFRTR